MQDNQPGPQPHDPGAGARGAQTPKIGRDHRAKLVFLAVAIVAAALVYWLQQRPPQQAADWTNLDDAIKQARVEHRRVLVLFMTDPPDETTRRLFDTTLDQPANKIAIANGKFIKAKVIVDLALKSETAAKHNITALPTMLLLDADGKEVNRRKGFIGEVPFRQDFLSCKLIEKP